MEFVTDCNQEELPADTDGPPITRGRLGGVRLGGSRTWDRLLA